MISTLHLIMFGDQIERMKWAGHVARTGIEEVYTGFGWRNLSERDHLEYPDIDGRIIIR